MSKYSYEFKLKIVQAYLNGEGGGDYLAYKYHITNKASVQAWVTSYKRFGKEGLMRSRRNEIYSFEFKSEVVKLYLTNEVSYRELALSVGMNNSSLIVKWVNDFRNAGPDALRPKRKGRRTEVSKSKKNLEINCKSKNTDSEYLKQLEDENLKLRIENAYLKELRRLRLEGIPQNKKRESSTASEDLSD